MTLDEIRIANTPASFEPALDYVVTKIAALPVRQVQRPLRTQLGTQMKATGEVMCVGRTMEESLLKAVRSLETAVCHIYHKKFDDWTVDRLLSYIKEGTDDRHLRHRRADPPGRRAGADLQQHQNRHVLPREV